MVKSRINLYLSGLFLGFFYTLTAYINSSFLKNFLDDKAVSLLYIAASTLSAILLLLAPKIIRKIGIREFFLTLSLIEIFTTFGLSIETNTVLISLLFISHLGLGPVLLYCLDIFLEHDTKKESETGESRGTFLTFQNIAWVSSPLLVGILAPSGQFGHVYTLSATLIIPALVFILMRWNDFKDLIPTHFNTISSIKKILKGGDRQRVIVSNIILQFFYASMVVYLPLLLISTHGFIWKELGIIFTIMLLPFLLLEYPIGYLEDKKIGEKEIMALGFVIMAIFTYIVSNIESNSLVIWAGILFTTRVGASMVEISNESFFFKHVKENDSSLIGIFRSTRPIAYILAPLLSIPILKYGDYSSIFLVLSFITMSGLLFIPKRDTK